jgi:hypothetical protein
MTTTLAVQNANPLTPEKVALIKRTIAKGRNKRRLELFIAQCNRTGPRPVQPSDLRHQALGTTAPNAGRSWRRRSVSTASD